MKEIKLSKGLIAFVDDSDYLSLKAYKWYAQKNHNTFYAARHTEYTKGKRQTILMHRELLNAPFGVQVDHRDRNGLNNTRQNIRLATQALNSHNVPSKGKSGFKGVRLRSGNRKRPWKSEIKVNGKSTCVGYFETKEEAAKAYDIAAKAVYGNDANTNF